MRRVVLVVLVLALPQAAAKTNAQAPDTLWTRTYGGPDADKGYSIHELVEGGFVVAGKTLMVPQTTYYDVYVVRIDENGDTLWSRTYGGPDDDGGHCVRQTSDGGFIIAGYTRSFASGGQDFYLIKTDSSGDTLWTRTYGGSQSDDLAWSVEQTSDGGYIVLGETTSYGPGSWDLYLVKTDANGDTAWSRTYGGTNWEWGKSVQQTADGGYVVAGVTISFGAGGEDFYVVKTDANGDTIWTRTYGGGNWDAAQSIKQMPDEGYIIAGWSRSFGDSDGDVYLVRTDAGGDTLWTRIYGSTLADAATSVDVTSDGGFIITGRFGLAYVWILRTDASGDTLWTLVVESDQGGSVGEEVWQTSDGGYIIGGSTTALGTYDIYVVRLAADGGCSYTPADVNGNGAVNVVDITALVNWVTLAQEPGCPCDCLDNPPFYACADVNGNCVVNVVDITAIVNWIVYGIPPEYCPDCPPTG